jgi:hypothetical protein
MLSQDRGQRPRKPIPLSGNTAVCPVRWPARPHFYIGVMVNQDHKTWKAIAEQRLGVPSAGRPVDRQAARPVKQPPSRMCCRIERNVRGTHGFSGVNRFGRRYWRCGRVCGKRCGECRRASARFYPQPPLVATAGQCRKISMISLLCQIRHLSAPTRLEAASNSPML